MPEHPAAAWARQAALTPTDIDCTTTVMLKILDGKCKMNPQEKEIIAVIYDVVKDRPGHILDDTDHRLIALARQGMDDALVERIYEQRLIAETMISRPVMKAYKAMLRASGVLATAQSEHSTEDI
ncbi:MAG: hypothetical protein JSS57_19090 [Proteobacteria bacterium]|nr:hypothetical protein [Pseudomonadota bacterium]RTL25725.1 MAG: hypothetical protein EKK49_19475 [Rhodocyclaceae bacterium]